VALSNAAKNALLDHYLKGSAMAQPTNVHLSLHTGDPGTTGANEVAGGSYARQLLNSAFAAASGGSKASNAVVDFTGMPAVGGSGVTHSGIWLDGVFWQGQALSAAKVVNAGDTFRFPVASLTATLT
jgi:hypothetical protein